MTNFQIVAGLQAGRIVNYLMANGRVRPMLVIDALDQTGKVNGLLFFDGENDRGNFVVRPKTDQFNNPIQPQHVSEVEFDDENEKPGTWHWPGRAPVVASGVDASVIETFKQELIAVVNEKLAVLAAAQADFRTEVLSAVNTKLQESKIAIVGEVPTVATPAQAVASENTPVATESPSDGSEPTSSPVAPSDGQAGL